MELQVIQSKIYDIRGFRVIFDFDLALLYQIETRRLKEQVKRNLNRFPPDFMFQLTQEEHHFLRSQIAISENALRVNQTRYPPFAFTEQGVAMLSSVLRTEKAVEVNIVIMRAFVRLRELITGYSELNRKLEEYMVENDMRIADIMDILYEMQREKQKEQRNDPRRRIGFK